MPRRRRGGRWIEVTDRQDWWWATTLPASRVPTRTLWEIAHGRWEIENELFNTLVTHWSLNHCYKHDPTAIVNFILTLFIVFNPSRSGTQVPYGPLTVLDRFPARLSLCEDPLDPPSTPFLS